MKLDPRIARVSVRSFVHTMAFYGTEAMQLNDDEEPLECTLTHTKIDLEVDLDTQASPQKSRVTYSELSPILGKSWSVTRPGGQVASVL